MATFEKKEKEKKRLKKRQDKLKKKEERKATSKGGSLDDMIAYVDENGVISDTPPDPTKRRVIDVESIAVGVPKQEDVEYDPIRTGRVEFFDPTKGFGFINDNETKEKLFVHKTGLLDEICEGNTVTFEVEKGMKGLNAVRVSLKK